MGSRSSLHQTLRIGRNEDGGCHDQCVVDEVDAPEWIDCHVEGKDERNCRESSH
jgi:hypothetical protein